MNSILIHDLTPNSSVSLKDSVDSKLSIFPMYDVKKCFSWTVDLLKAVCSQLLNKIKSIGLQTHFGFTIRGSKMRPFSTTSFSFWLVSKLVIPCNTGSLFYEASAPSKLLQRFFRLNFRIPTCDTESSRQIRPVSASSFFIKYGVKGFIFGLGLDLILGTRGCSFGSRIIKYTINDFRWSQSAW